MKKITIGFMIFVFSFVGMASFTSANNGLDDASIKQENLKMELRDDKGYSPHDIKETEMKLRYGTDDMMDRGIPSEESGNTFIKERIKINENKPKLGEDRGFHLGQIMKHVHERAKVRFEVSITRMEQLQARIQSRIDKMKLEGKDTVSAQASLDISKSKLAEAKSFTAQAKLIIDPHITSDPKTELSDTHKAQVKELLAKAKVSIKESFEAMKNSINALKNIIN